MTFRPVFTFLKRAAKGLFWVAGVYLGRAPSDNRPVYDLSDDDVAREAERRKRKCR